MWNPMNREDFYIGWKDNVPAPTASFLKKALTTSGMVIIIATVISAWVQRPFNDHRFELGHQRVVSGTYFAKPVPFLIAREDDLPDGVDHNILLLGYGKFGVEDIIDDIEEVHGSLSGQQVKLRGTLIYGSGHTLMELSLKANSFEGFLEDRPRPVPIFPPVEPIQVHGEILDPKCYFGVMKPGEGKVHKSCAVRCISGGIPPVVRHETGNAGTPYQYYILLGAEGQKINMDILAFVGEDVILDGWTSVQHGWHIFYVENGGIALWDRPKGTK